MNISNPAAPKHWYKEPWPWLLAAGPAIVVVAAFYTAWLAYSTSDGLVTENYYKEGLSVSETLARDDHAQAVGLTARVSVTENSIRVRLSAKDGAVFTPPAAVRVMLSHPTRAGLDQTQILARESDYYSGEFHLPSSGHWLLLLEDEAKSWRLMASVMLPSSGEIVIGGEVPADIRN
jgi:uncharacterized protein